MTFEQTLAWELLRDFISSRLGTLPPRYPVGSEVTVSWIDEFGQAREEHGVIVGYFPAPPRWLPGWWYVVRWQSLFYLSGTGVAIEDECHESDLSLSGRDVA
jgi:hypothetical protein